MRLAPAADRCSPGTLGSSPEPPRSPASLTSPGVDSVARGMLPSAISAAAAADFADSFAAAFDFPASVWAVEALEDASSLSLVVSETI